MLIFLEVATGLNAGRILSLAPGDVCTVGSGWNTDICLADDSCLADNHFFVACEAERAILFGRNIDDLPYLNGEPCQQSDLSHLDWILAGSTLFRVFFADFSEPIDAETPTDVFIRYLQADPSQLYAIAEGGKQFETIAWFAQIHKQPVIPLFLDDSEQKAAFGGVRGRVERPWLLPLSGVPEAIPELVRRTWSRNCMILVRSAEPLAALRTHFARFLYAELHGAPTSFPYWNPGILRLALTSNHERFRSKFTAAVSEVLLEGETPACALNISAARAERISWAPNSATFAVPPQEILARLFIETKISGEEMQHRLVSQFPHLQASESQNISQLCRNAELSGMVSPPSVAQYVLLASIVGLDFARTSAVKELFSDSPLTPESALDLFALSINYMNNGSRTS